MRAARTSGDDQLPTHLARVHVECLAEVFEAERPDAIVALDICERAPPHRGIADVVEGRLQHGRHELSVRCARLWACAIGGGAPETFPGHYQRRPPPPPPRPP